MDSELYRGRGGSQNRQGLENAARGGQSYAAKWKESVGASPTIGLHG